MMANSHAKEVIGPDDVTFTHVWLTGGFLLFGVVALIYHIWIIRKAEKRSFKQGCIVAWGATIYLGLTLYAFVWALVHAVNNR